MMPGLQISIETELTHFVVLQGIRRADRRRNPPPVCRGFVVRRCPTRHPSRPAPAHSQNFAPARNHSVGRKVCSHEALFLPPHGPPPSRPATRGFFFAQCAFSPGLPPVRRAPLRVGPRSLRRVQSRRSGPRPAGRGLQNRPFPGRTEALARPPVPLA